MLERCSFIVDHKFLHRTNTFCFRQGNKLLVYKMWRYSVIDQLDQLSVDDL